MSEPRWTPAQRAAIDDRGGALLVSAAAGSGKTAVLTERAVRLITDPEHPVDADRLLIVTFTNAAAAELRARIGQALLRRCQQEPGNTALRRQRMLLQRAPICTMDAFCLDLLHKHFQALDIPPDFTPADPGSVELLRASALAETLEHAYADPDFCAFADLYGKGRTDKPAGDTILQVYDFLRALPDYDRKLDEFLAPWQQENGFDATCWHDLLLAQAARDAKAARELLCAAQQDCREDYAQEMAEAGEKKTPAAIRKAEAAVAEKYADAQGRLERSAALLGEVERLAQAGEWTPLYDRLTPFVLGMEEQPGLKGMKKRLKGDHKTAIKHVFEILKNVDKPIDGIGHRVVQGGWYFPESKVVTDETLGWVREVAPLAPLHNYAEADVIEICREMFPEIGNVIVADTSFHYNMPAEAHNYALPKEVVDSLHIRKYGAHGTSHRFIWRSVDEASNHTAHKVVSCHLGSGASLCAIEDGKCMDTTMGLTPLDGLIMGTRCGTVDPATVFYLSREGHYSIDEIDTMMNKQSGLAAISGVSSIDLKQDEPGLLAACRANGWQARFYSAAQLRAVPGSFTGSRFVASVTGVDNVCERAALYGGGRLLVQKQALGGVTVAVAEEPWEVRFG